MTTTTSFPTLDEADLLTLQVQEAKHRGDDATVSHLLRQARDVGHGRLADTLLARMVRDDAATGGR